MIVNLLLLINIIMNWAVIGLLTTFVWLLFYPRPSWLPIAVITTIIMTIIVKIIMSPLGDRYRATKYRELTLEEGKYLMPIFNNIYEKTGLKKPPRLLIADDNESNAMVTGNNLMILNRGLITKHPPNEVAAVIAHEFGHIINGDAHKTLLAWAVNMSGDIILGAMIGIIMFISFNRRNPLLFPLIIYAGALKFIRHIFVQILKVNLQFIYRRDEYKADAFAKEIGLGEDLASYFSKLPNNPTPELFSTHPHNRKRIQKLRYS